MDVGKALHEPVPTTAAPAPRPKLKHLLSARDMQQAEHENDARAAKLRLEDESVGEAMAGLSWKDIDRLPASTSGQRLLVRKIKGRRITGWDRLHSRHGCPHCPAAENGGCIRHIFWDCPMAQALWAALKRPWDLEEPWGRDEAGIKQSIFGLDLYAFPGDIWAHMGRVDPNDHIGATIIQDTAKVAWQQHVLVTLASIWRWRHHVVDDRIGWTKDQAVLYHSAALRASLRGLLQRLPVLTHVCDPRRHLLRVLEARLEATPVPNPAPGAGPRHVLFFDGGSRGNPGREVPEQSSPESTKTRFALKSFGVLPCHMHTRRPRTTAPNISVSSQGSRQPNDTGGRSRSWATAPSSSGSSGFIDRPSIPDYFPSTPWPADSQTSSRSASGTTTSAPSTRWPTTWRTSRWI